MASHKLQMAASVLVGGFIGRSLLLGYQVTSDNVGMALLYGCAGLWICELLQQIVADNS